MGIVKRIIIFFIAIIFINYICRFIVGKVGIEDKDSLPIIMWFNLVALFVVILPPFSGLLFQTGGKIIRDNMDKSKKLFDRGNTVRKIVTMGS